MFTVTLPVDTDNFFALAAIRVYQSQNVLILHMSRPKQLLS